MTWPLVVSKEGLIGLQGVLCDAQDAVSERVALLQVNS